MEGPYHEICGTFPGAAERWSVPARGVGFPAVSLLEVVVRELATGQRLTFGEEADEGLVGGAAPRGLTERAGRKARLRAHS